MGDAKKTENMTVEIDTKRELDERVAKGINEKVKKFVEELETSLMLIGYKVHVKVAVAFGSDEKEDPQE